MQQMPITAKEIKESNAVRKLRSTSEKTEAIALYPFVVKKIDKLAKVNIIHKNKANNLKSKLAIYINKLA